MCQSFGRTLLFRYVLKSSNRRHKKMFLSNFSEQIHEWSTFIFYWTVLTLISLYISSIIWLHNKKREKYLMRDIQFQSRHMHIYIETCVWYSLASTSTRKKKKTYTRTDDEFWSDTKTMSVDYLRLSSSSSVSSWCNEALHREILFFFFFEHFAFSDVLFIHSSFFEMNINRSSSTNL